jgi:hypothetical protein
MISITQIITNVCYRNPFCAHDFGSDTESGYMRLRCLYFRREYRARVSGKEISHYGRNSGVGMNLS